MIDPLFFHDDLRDELAAVEQLTRGLTAPDGEQAIGELQSKLRIADDNASPYRWRTGELPWVTNSVQQPVDFPLASGALHADPGDVVTVEASWFLDPHPRALRNPRTIWICRETTTTVTVKKPNGHSDSVAVPVSYSALGTGPTISVPATIACVIECVAAAVAPDRFRSAAREMGAGLSEWHELHKQRLTRLASWQLEKAFYSTSAGLEAHHWVPPSDLFVRRPTPRTRPHGRISA